MANIAAGRLRHVVTIQKKIQKQDYYTGEIVDTWVDYEKVRAAVEPLSVREFFAAGREKSKVTTKIIIRYIDGLDHSMRIVHRKRHIDRIYNIEGILADKDSGEEYITIPCYEGVNEG